MKKLFKLYELANGGQILVERDFEENPIIRISTNVVGDAPLDKFKDYLVSTKKEVVLNFSPKPGMEANPELARDEVFEEIDEAKCLYILDIN